MNTSALKIGFIGLGKMGSGICENIQKAGYSLTVYNRTVSKTEPFQQRGANVASSIKQLVEQSDIIFTSVLDDKSLNDLCQGEHGILESMTAGKIHVGLTTIQPTTADALKTGHEKRACHYIAAPVVGRPDAAAAGQLITFLAGNTTAIDAVLPIIDTYTVKHVLVGSVASSANAMKICVNYMAMAQLAMLGEIFTFAEKRQLDQRQVLAVAKMFFAGNEAMSSYAEKIANREFDTVGFDLSAGLKDALIFDTAFTACGVKPSAILGAKENLIAANANGLGNKDWSALTEITRQLAGLSNQ
ncbi:NAD(P)-dependent oxidoreductase [Vibrio furnissii]|uniref:NAD(P)-dependent oxidoreductase n=1 Tax=Vibrio furnissii TaxID=29494 RepID=UPI0001B91687|nr:NAD(P)-dependent oxidoreductase [Vibrio furnissii]EEX40402.1 6-phosphogluconate dehydrogenase NAD-binding [Vibrio furnissii CIP 102972]QDC95090.1 NAD(P)-dependent oxidoreductase [Vibrio furnissii]UON50529.1 NAD(P)-dependent oxidoreductase [Vibrio furnissii]SUQ32801.1 3-hydroxyisobutyrate dehydrogenase [Vibrio furnissii]